MVTVVGKALLPCKPAAARHGHSVCRQNAPSSIQLGELALPVQHAYQEGKPYKESGVEEESHL